MVDMRLRIKQLREAAGLNQSELARRMGVTPQAVQKWESHGGPKGARLQALASALGTTVDGLIGLSAAHAHAEVLPDDSYSSERRLSEQRQQDRREEITVLHLMNASASMGGGCVAPMAEHAVCSMSVDTHWLRRYCRFTKIDNLALIHAIGDSMQPTFRNGDILIVDRGVTDAKVDSVFVMARGDELFIKRLQRHPDGSHMMISDNPVYQPIRVQVADDLHVLGRVVGTWNFKEL